MPKTSYFANLLLGVKRAVALAWPATVYVALLTCNKGPRSALNSQAVALNDFICLFPNGDTKLHLYKVTTAGTLAAAQGTLYPGVANEAITDGTAVLTEQTTALQAMTGASMAVGAEPTVGTNGYARIAIASNTTNWAAAAGMAIQNAGAAWTWPQATPAGWTSGLQAVWGIALIDQAAAGGGNVWEYFGLTAPIQVSALATPSIAAAAFTATES
jgi:hypothetical protein